MQTVGLESWPELYIGIIRQFTGQLMRLRLSCHRSAPRTHIRMMASSFYAYWESVSDLLSLALFMSIIHLPSNVGSRLPLKLSGALVNGEMEGPGSAGKEVIKQCIIIASQRLNPAPQLALATAHVGFTIAGFVGMCVSWR